MLTRFLLWQVWKDALGATQPPTGIGYTLLLIAHMVSAVVGFGALFLTGFEALRARGGPESNSSEAVRRYFHPGVNWAARVLYLVPVLGFALLADSHGAFDASDPFIVIGMCLWAAAIFLAEGLIWPAERRIQRAVTDNWEDTSSLRRDCELCVAASGACVVLFVAALVVMFAKP